MEFNNDNAKVVSEGYLTYLYGKLKNKLNSSNLSKSVRAVIEGIDIDSLQAVIVDKLPAVGEKNVVYLIQPAKQDPTSHSYDEYLYISPNRYEYVGDSDLNQFPDNEYLHFHRHMSVLEGLSESEDGKLLYKGKVVGSGSGSGGSSGGGDSGGDSGGGSGGDSGGGSGSGSDLNLGDIIDDIWGEG